MKRTAQLLRRALPIATLAGLIMAGLGVKAQGLLEIKQADTPYNSQFQGGKPSAGTPTAGQFAGFMSVGGASIDTSANPQPALRQVLAGTTYFGQATTYLFGQVIPVPQTDADGGTDGLTNAQGEAVAPEVYWRAEPHTTNEHAGDPVYWSKHKGAVFATQAGPVEITWRSAVVVATSEPADYSDSKYFLEGGNYFRLFKKKYVVSGAAFKPPRKLYWTEQTFSALGVLVTIPSGRIRVVHPIFNSNFPETVPNQYFAAGEPQPTLNLYKTNTFYQISGQIHAYNAEGRILVEFLGDALESGENAKREFLGYEIVDVARQPTPDDVTVELGDRLRAFPDGRDDSLLTPSPLPSAEAYLYRDANRTPNVLYATDETQTLNDVFVHWLETDDLGLQWPSRFVRYRQIWPADLARYSHYLRPPAATDEEAQQTAVPLPASDGPTIAYQDPLDLERAKIAPDSRFYTRLDDQHTVHRTLLLYRAGDRVAFERVLSSLSSALNRPDGAGEIDLRTLPPDAAVALRPGRSTFLSLDGATGYGQLPPASYNDGKGFTLEAWVYPRARPRGSALLAFGEGGVETAVWLFATGSGPANPVFRVGTTANQVELGGLLPLNAWLHMAVVQDAPVNGSSKATTHFYINGVEQKSKSITVLTANNLELYVGRRPAEGFANAGIDDLRIWKIARSAAEIQQDMASSGYPAGTPNLAAQFGFEFAFDGGATIRDTSGHDRHMTLHGSAVVDNDPLRSPAAGVSLDSPGIMPRYLQTTALVGDRIPAPTGEFGSGEGEGYWSGSIRVASGNSYYPSAYQDPFAVGFDAANRGAIIPVNAIPGTNVLEVWWFRPSATNSVRNPANGFHSVYWPAVMARYSLAWPSSGSEIVLAGNDGSGGLPSLQAEGSIYAQNDPTLAGYNPNEEHALMLGGQAWALRDDLNITSGTDYSSAPYTLLAYTESDGRPAMRAFHVLREKPADGIVFDYLIEAATPLQAPMPLPLLPLPLEVTAEGVQINYNTEPSASEDLPGNWDSDRDGGGLYGRYNRFTWQDRKNQFWVYRAKHDGPPSLKVGTYSAGDGTITNPAPATAVANADFSYSLHASRLTGSLVMKVSGGGSLPAWLSINGLTLEGKPQPADTNVLELPLTITAVDDQAEKSVTLTINVVASGTPAGQAPIAITSENSYAHADVTYAGRPPYLAESPTPANSFTMRFYYRTKEGFAWPGVDNPPAVDSIVPYLRPIENGAYTGEPGSKDTAALDIVYRPYWPYSEDRLPKMDLSDTLTLPKNGLPAIRGQTSARILYQQSIAADITKTTNGIATLHDATREKSSGLKSHHLEKAPAGVRTSVYQGKVYFPDLPPHLAPRIFIDPNNGPGGRLVFKGEFKDEAVGEKYLLLNVLSQAEIAAVKGLCPTGDADKVNWDLLIDDLQTTLETFEEKLDAPGTFMVGSSNVVGVAELAEVNHDDIAVDSYALSANGPGVGYLTLIVGNGKAFTPESEPVSMYVIKVRPQLHVGEVKVIAAANPFSEMITFQHTPDLAGKFADFEYEWMIGPPVDGLPPPISPAMTGWSALTSPPQKTDQPRFTLGGSGIQTMADNYITLRYRPKNASHPLKDQWSTWTEPQLAEGWIKRVLAGINPFNQRVNDLFNNTVNTDVSLLTQAGHRWEGDVPLSLENINDFGLIEIYETVLRRGRALSIDAGINYGPANDALLLVSGYLNDLYMIVGNEAWADAANPTIGLGSKDNTYGAIATSLFAFKGQVPSLLEEEMALLRGRDDFLQPGVTTPPVYNRMFWNYTRGIDAGEVIYALNYNILENPNGPVDGVVNADDARRLYPQGHGDAYGHYLTSVKGYYSLVLDNDFDWVPRTEAVTILGKPVQVDYQDERKFASACAALARAGRQVFDLTWRRDYKAGHGNGWEHFAVTRENTRTGKTRYWGLDSWASRSAQGAYLNWVAGNAILPDVDPDPNHEGIQKIDRTTVPELGELVSTLSELQTDMDNAEGNLSPLGLPDGAVAFDLNPSKVVSGGDQTTHFEQMYDRAKGALKNALAAFDDAKDVTRLMRSEQDSLAELQAQVASQELAYQNSLIELYGTPYPDDIGPGKTYAQGYAGPDLIHYTYVDLPEIVWPNLWNYVEIPEEGYDFVIDLQDLPCDWTTKLFENFDFLTKQDEDAYKSLDPRLICGTDPPLKADRKLKFPLGPHGFSDKPPTWLGHRSSPGSLQQGISELIASHRRLKLALYANSGGKADFDKHLRLFEQQARSLNQSSELEAANLQLQNDMDGFQSLYDAASKDWQTGIALADMALAFLTQSTPKDTIAGAAFGGDTIAPGVVGAATAFANTLKLGLLSKDTVAFHAFLESMAEKRANILTNSLNIEVSDLKQAFKDAVYDLFKEFEELQAALDDINFALRDFDDATRKIQALRAQGDRLQAERQVFRQRSAALVQGFRTRDAAFRIFRNEKLERYKALFELASRYALLAVNAYDYETGLLNTSKGQAFINRIVSSRALGVLREGEPQFAGSDAGDPGLSSAMAEMKADWDVIKGRLGFNNPDAYGTTVSLRGEKMRILPGADGHQAWQDTLNAARMDNILLDPDVRRQCLQIDRGNSLPVPGIVLEFSTTITDGLNLFGLPLAGFDHAYSSSSFATKIHAVGVALEGYVGMDNPSANSGAVQAAGGNSTAEPSFSFLDTTALAATPYVYLIPVGVDSMRSPALGDARAIRTWDVSDVTVPLPFNIGASDFSTKKLFQTSDSLSEPLFSVRKHQAFRPVSTASIFSQNIYSGNGGLAASQFTNRRLIGRSVWNSKWKLVIPGQTLLSDPNEGLRRFVNSVTDIKLHFVTYSYSGN